MRLPLVALLVLFVLWILLGLLGIAVAGAVLLLKAAVVVAAVTVAVGWLLRNFTR